MNFNKHSNLSGTHAFLSASSYHWLNYDKDKLIQSYLNYKAKETGTRLHAFAAEAISLGITLPKTNKTLNMYINDAIGYKMIPEQPLFYSMNCYGTADSIVYRRKNLRIHDLKTGTTPGSFNQLKIYAALFCLEYDVKPGDIDMELRIYQNHEIQAINPTADDILPIMDKIILFDQYLNEIKEE